MRLTAHADFWQGHFKKRNCLILKALRDVAEMVLPLNSDVGNNRQVASNAQNVHS